VLLFSATDIYWLLQNWNWNKIMKIL